MSQTTIEYARSLPTPDLEKLILAGELDHLKKVEFTSKQVSEFKYSALVYMFDKDIIHTKNTIK